MSEAIFKTAKMIDEMAKGASEVDAGIEAHYWLMDYSLVPPWVRYARNAPFGMPFITWTYKVIPLLAEVALTKPWRFLPYIAAIQGLSMAVQAIYDVDDDDVDALKMSMREWLREKGHAYILPYKDDRGRWQVLDLGYIVPWGGLAELFNEITTGKPGAALGTLGLFGGPIADLITAIRTNVDPFTKRPILDSRDPPHKQVGDLTRYVWRLAAPPFITDIGWAGQTINALEGTPRRTGEPGPTLTQSQLRLIGLNVYPLEPERSRAEEIRQQMFEINAVRNRMRFVLADRSLTPDQRDRARDRYIGLVQSRQNKLRTYIEKSRINPKLATAS